MLHSPKTRCWWVVRWKTSRINLLRVLWHENPRHHIHNNAHFGLSESLLSPPQCLLLWSSQYLLHSWPSRRLSFSGFLCICFLSCWNLLEVVRRDLFHRPAIVFVPFASSFCLLTYINGNACKSCYVIFFLFKSSTKFTISETFSRALLTNWFLPFLRTFLKLPKASCFLLSWPTTHRWRNAICRNCGQNWRMP